jgi:hypothetical protein
MKQGELKSVQAEIDAAAIIFGVDRLIGMKIG